MKGRDEKTPAEQSIHVVCYLCGRPVFSVGRAEVECLNAEREVTVGSITGTRIDQMKVFKLANS